jgi:4-amino-4-deoxy-L-arabinose transferase-like glycosyltransferase
MNTTARLRRPWTIFLVLFLTGATLRLGYGAARYDASLSTTGADFIRMWDFDGIEHVLIAKSLIDQQTYRVASIPGLEGKNIRAIGQDALFKAPLYEAFLAAVFAVSGFNFALFFPLQALLGGVLSGLAALVALAAFDSRRVAYMAGLAAAAHPVLVNSASQPYNENLFFALLFGSIWAFSGWLASGRWPWALASGILGGLAILCRETAIPLVAIMGVFPLFLRVRTRRFATSCLVLAAAALVVLPWTARNYAREGTLILVASNTGTALGIGNNACVGADPISSPYWAEGPCRSLDASRAALLGGTDALARAAVVTQDRVYGTLGARFIREQPLTYLKLSLRRAWTVLLPFHPKAQQGRLQRAMIAGYWLLVIPAGLAGAAAHLRRSGTLPALLVLLIAATLLPLVLVYFSPDMRYRIGADLLLGVFAGWLYARLAVTRPALQTAWTPNATR